MSVLPFRRRAQPRLPKGERRENLGSGVLGKIKRAVEREAARYKCSKSFVVATILGAHFGVIEQADYAAPVHRDRVVRLPKRRSA